MDVNFPLSLSQCSFSILFYSLSLSLLLLSFPPSLFHSSSISVTISRLTFKAYEKIDGRQIDFRCRKKVLQRERNKERERRKIKFGRERERRMKLQKSTGATSAFDVTSLILSLSLFFFSLTHSLSLSFSLSLS